MANTEPIIEADGACSRAEHLSQLVGKLFTDNIDHQGCVVDFNNGDKRMRGEYIEKHNDIEEDGLSVTLTLHTVVSSHTVSRARISTRSLVGDARFDTFRLIGHGDKCGTQRLVPKPVNRHRHSKNNMTIMHWREATPEEEQYLLKILSGFRAKEYCSDKMIGTVALKGT